MPQSKSNRITYLLIPLSFMAIFALISKGPFHGDCLYLALSAEKTWTLYKIHPMFGSGYPLTVLLAALGVGLLRCFSVQDPVMAVNIMNVCFGSLSLFLLYILGRKIFSPLAALFSALLLFTFPIFLGLAVYGNSHIPSLFFLLGGILFIVNFRQDGDRKNFFLGSVFLGLMGGARLQDMILMMIPVSVLLLLGAPRRWKKNDSPPRGVSLVSLIEFWIIAILVAAAFHLLFIFKQNRGYYIDQFFLFWNWGVTTNFRGIFSSFLPASFLHILFGLTPVGMFLTICGFVLLLRKNPRIFAFFLLWFAVPFAFYGNLNSSVPRFFLLPSIPLILAQGYFFAYLFSFRNQFFRLTTMIVFCSMIFVLFTQIYPILKFRHEHMLLPDFGKYVASATEKDAQIITGDEIFFVMYYGQRAVFGRPETSFDFRQKDWIEFKTKLDGLLDQGIPVYITGSGLYSYDPGFVFSSFMKKNYDLTLIGIRIAEDWHQGETRLRTGKEKLFRIHKKSVVKDPSY